MNDDDRVHNDVRGALDIIILDDFANPGKRIQKRTGEKNRSDKFLPLWTQNQSQSRAETDNECL